MALVGNRSGTSLMQGNQSVTATACLAESTPERPMEQLKTIATRTFCLLARGNLALGVGMASPVLADGSHGGSSSCSNHTLKGVYILTQDGWESRAPSTTWPAGDRRPFPYAGQEEYDGRGNFTAINAMAPTRRPDRAPAVTVSPFVPHSGTYSVNRDCTALWTSPDEDGFTSHDHLFPSPEGDKFTFGGVDARVLGEGDVLTTGRESVGDGVAYRVDR